MTERAGGPRPLPHGRLSGRWRAPGSKSFTNRALIAAALAPGRSVLSGALVSDDTRALASALESLGARLTVGEDVVEVEGPLSRDAEREVLIDVGAAGTPARFLLALLSALPGRFTLDGSPRMRERPMGPLLNALREAGAKIESLGREGFLPVRIEGGTLVSGRVPIRADVSSQFLSALLLVAPIVRGGLEIESQGNASSAAYVTLTRQVIASFMEPDGAYGPRAYAVPGDDSAACFFIAGAVLSGGSVEIAGLVRDSEQPDAAFRDWVDAAGGAIGWDGDLLTAGGGPGTLRPLAVDVDAAPDAALPLMALLAMAQGTSRVTGVARLREKESDRLAAAIDLLFRAGTPAEIEDGDGGAPELVIEGAAVRPRRADFLAHDDHRVAMSAAVLALVLPQGSTLDAPEVVSKSNPRFWEDWDRLVHAPD